MVQRPSNFAFEIIKRNNYVDYFYSILYAFSFVKRREAASWEQQCNKSGAEPLWERERKSYGGIIVDRPNPSREGGVFIWPYLAETEGDEEVW